jgi:hypothetical protein
VPTESSVDIETFNKNSISSRDEKQDVVPPPEPISSKFFTDLFTFKFKLEKENYS